MYHPAFHVVPRVYRLVEDIGRSAERIRSSAVRLPWVPTLVKDAMARLAYGSTAIEGCTLSLEAVRGLLEGRAPVGYPDRHVRMARNYLDALAWLKRRGGPTVLSPRGLFALHRIMAEGAVDEGPVGRYRTVDVRAGLHVAPPWREVPRLTRDFLHSARISGGEYPAVIASAILHLRMAEIHPFRDGNGRVARALGTWQLYRGGLDTLHIFALDEILLENRSLYIKALQRVQVERRDLGTWIEFYCEAILETLERVENRLRVLGPGSAEPVSLTPRQEKLLLRLRESGSLGIRDIARALRLTVPGAHYALRPLMRAGLVARVGEHKKARYLLGSPPGKGGRPAGRKAAGR